MANREAARQIARAAKQILRETGALQIDSQGVRHGRIRPRHDDLRSTQAVVCLRRFPIGWLDVASQVVIEA